MMLRNIVGGLYTGWVILVFTVFMIILLPFILFPVMISEKLGFITYGALKVWSWIFSMLTFIRYDVSGREKVNWKNSYIFVSNHTSFLDAPGISLGIVSQFRPLAKKELKKIPIFGWIVAAATIVVDRSSPESRKASLNLLKKILSHGISILIFPEGTQNRTDQPLQPFYDGAFRTSFQTATPVVPIVIVNAGNLMPPGTLRVRPGRIKVIFESPISPEDFETPAALRSHTYATMYRMLTGEDLQVTQAQ
ncbi:lysophospholipid acyltransferase family protein [Fulvivirga sedimenti]|uniref:1-acyl-sn-glycerol-3-phosphate acyltransferase n=1 Tax=Fulvivirga sedimenti TaxID=2879465 RepID=A0A9X1L0V9_9BACT|nr:lysophospholipid acyltransferase family protein [Fulvivirga sedimenti]MCA6075322.1 1-acyl-sn-glycerol-3-phosphate acyltransferase [Fulvivirga sedimenti]MCA6076499.1 1-acyl-sn-glycerol-3-phosphate acyltransferase [Fulvivirga sedimenti]MCA6077627.1 1-acyl-sn-glycerol-3-phosphate acyltransferase [Fulvivirga sedimenti]